MIKLEAKERLPAELIEVLSSEEFDDEAGILIESVNFEENNVQLVFSIRFDADKSMSDQFWQVIVKDNIEERIIREWVQDIEIYTEHLLLLDHSDIYSELYFKGTTPHSGELFVDVFRSIKQLTINIPDISKYLFSPERINELSSQGYGLFARGPKTILKLYAECLSKYGIKPIFIGEMDQPLHNQSLKLLQIGNSYFIGHGFDFERKD